MRKLRIDMGAEQRVKPEETSAAETTQSARKLRVGPDAQVLEKIDRYASLKQELAVRDAAHKAATDGLRKQVEALQTELLAYGQEQQLDTVTSGSNVLVFSARNERRIDPKVFLAFLQGHGRTKEFYDFVTVPLTGAVKSFGEAVLEASGVLVSTTKQYSGLKVSALK